MDLQSIKSLVESTLGPQVAGALSTIYYTFIAPLLTERQLGPLPITSAIVASLLFFVFWIRRGQAQRLRGFFGYLIPRGVYLHRSAILDYKYFVINQLFMTHANLAAIIFWAFGLLGVTQLGNLILTAFFGPGPAEARPSLAIHLLFTLLTLMAFDLGKFLAHYLLHKVKLLWEFHKVHHSAEVLTPVSAFRLHPVEKLLDLFFRLLITGIVSSVFVYLYPGGSPELTILAFNAVGFFIYYPLFILQHSHVAIGYGPRLSKIMVSPLMHQVHHSLERQHWDKNLGFTFSFWDRLFGTLYVPAQDEKFRLGLPEGSGRFDTLWALYVGPFQRMAQRVMRTLPRRGPSQ